MTMFQNLRRMLADGGTLKIACEADGCGHAATLPRHDALRLLGPDAIPADVRRRLRCSRCGEASPRVWI